MKWKDVEWDGSVIVWNTVLEFEERDWGRPRKLCFRAPSLGFRIWTRDILNTNYKCHPLNLRQKSIRNTDSFLRINAKNNEGHVGLYIAAVGAKVWFCLRKSAAFTYGLHETVRDKSQMMNREKCISSEILPRCLSHGRLREMKAFGTSFKLDRFQTNAEAEKEELTEWNVERKKLICWNGRCNNNP